MLMDLRELVTGSEIEADLCIVGAGAAGIAIARELRDMPWRVVVVETGGLEKHDPYELLNRGLNAGPHRVNLRSRLRYLGGATNHWGGNCGPLDEVDFEDRPWVPHARWPFPLSALEPYYERAQELCGLWECEYSPEYWARADAEFGRDCLAFPCGELTTKVFQRQPYRFGEVYRATLAAADERLRVLLHGTVLKLGTNADGTRVEEAQVGTLDGARFTVRAREYVLAAHLENARLLLLSDDRSPAGIGNQHGNVGRYFIRHLNVFSGAVIPNPPCRDLSLYSVHTDMTEARRDAKKLVAALQVAPRVQRRMRILNAAAFVARIEYVQEKKLAPLRDWLRRIQQDSGGPVYLLRNWLEQAPVPGNCITLSKKLDAFGLRQMRMHFEVGEQERRTLHIMHDVIRAAFERHGYGEVRSALPPVDGDWPAALAESSHFMGGTRMSTDPREGVVDEHCRVHGVGNLHVAGGSVMPTGGATMVTYNMLALALRLADRLKAVLRADDAAREIAPGSGSR